MKSKLNVNVLQDDLDNKPKGGGENSKTNLAKFLNLPYGDTLVNILMPNEDLGGRPYYELAIHYGFLDPSTGKTRVYKCSRKKHGKCPICDIYYPLKDGIKEMEDLKKAGDLSEDELEDLKVMKERASAIVPQKRFLHIVLDSSSNLRVLAAKSTQAQVITLELIAAMKDEGLDITDFGTLYPIRVTRLKDKPWATARYLNKKNLELSDGKINYIEENMPILSKIYEDFTPEELTKMLNGEEISKSRLKKQENQKDTETEETTTKTEKTTTSESKKVVKSKEEKKTVEKTKRVDESKEKMMTKEEISKREDNPKLKEERVDEKKVVTEQAKQKAVTQPSKKASSKVDEIMARIKAGRKG